MTVREADSIIAALAMEELLEPPEVHQLLLCSNATLGQSLPFLLELLVGDCLLGILLKHVHRSGSFAELLLRSPHDLLGQQLLESFSEHQLVLVGARPDEGLASESEGKAHNIRAHEGHPTVKAC